MQEAWVQSLGWEDALEEGKETHCSIPAWRSPGTEEPGEPQSVVSHRVGHDWSNLASVDNEQENHDYCHYEAGSGALVWELCLSCIELWGQACCDWLVMSAMGKRWDVVQGTGIACYLCFAINHFTSLHFFLQIEGLWQTCVKQVYQCHFSNFLCHVLVILPTFQPFSLYCNVYGDLWSVIFDVTIAKRLWLTQGSDDG